MHEWQRHTDTQTHRRTRRLHSSCRASVGLLPKTALMARRGGIQPGQGGAEGTDERVLSLHTDACEMVEDTSVEEGHDFESDVAEETMSVLVKLAKEICESCDIGQPAAECQLMVFPSKRKLVTQRCELRPVQGGAEDTEVVS